MSGTGRAENALFRVNYATQILCFVVVTPLVFLRIFVRWKWKHALGIDDAACFIGWALFMGFCTSALIYGFSGGTKPPSELSHDQHETCIKLSYIATAIYAPTALFVKTSLVYILIRVFSPFHQGMVALYCLLGIIVGYYIIITFIKIFICNPPAAYWTKAKKADAICLSQPGVIIADSIISFLTDVAIFAFPVALTWSLQMPIWKKIKVILLLGLGSVAVAFSLFRLVIGVYERDYPEETTMFMKTILTANAELGLGLICACLPALNVLSSHSQERPSLVQYFRRRKYQPQSSSHIYDGSQPGDPFSRSQLNSVARRGSTDSAALMASHGQAGLSVEDNNDSIIKMVSLNQHWESASQSGLEAIILPSHLVQVGHESSSNDTQKSNLESQTPSIGNGMTIIFLTGRVVFRDLAELHDWRITVSPLDLSGPKAPDGVLSFVEPVPWDEMNEFLERNRPWEQFDALHPQVPYSYFNRRLRKHEGSHVFYVMSYLVQAYLGDNYPVSHPNK